MSTPPPAAGRRRACACPRWSPRRRRPCPPHRRPSGHLTLTLTIVEAAIDMVGWQCGRAAASCGGGPLVVVPDWSWLRETGPRLAVTGLVPVGVVLLLWWLAHSTWLRAEAIAPPSAAP